MAFESPREVVASGQRTDDGDSGQIDMADVGRTLNLIVDVTAADTGTLDLTLEWSHDGGSTWAAAETPDAFSQMSSAGAVLASFDVKAPAYRIVWDLSDPGDFTFSVREYVT